MAMTHFPNEFVVFEVSRKCVLLRATMHINKRICAQNNDSNDVIKCAMSQDPANM